MQAALGSLYHQISQGLYLVQNIVTTGSMEVTSEYEGGASLLPPSTSTDVFLNAEGSGASAVDLLGAFDPDSFDFESKDLSPAWLNDIFSTNHRFPAELVPRLTG